MPVDGWRNTVAASEHRAGYEVSARTFRMGELLSQRTRVESIETDCPRRDFTPIPMLHWRTGPTTGARRSNPEAQSHPNVVN